MEKEFDLFVSYEVLGFVKVKANSFREAASKLVLPDDVQLTVTENDTDHQVNVVDYDLKVTDSDEEGNDDEDDEDGGVFNLSKLMYHSDINDKISPAVRDALKAEYQRLKANEANSDAFFHLAKLIEFERVLDILHVRISGDGK